MITSVGIGRYSFLNGRRGPVETHNYKLSPEGWKIAQLRQLYLQISTIDDQR
jgi:hypothetical protein